MGQSIDCQPHFGYQVGRRKASSANHAAKGGRKNGGLPSLQQTASSLATVLKPSASELPNTSAPTLLAMGSIHALRALASSAESSSMVKASPERLSTVRPRC